VLAPVAEWRGLAVGVSVAAGLGAAVALRRAASATIFRLAAMVAAAWALLATTALAWILAQGTATAVLLLARSPGALLAPAAVQDWGIGAVGAFAIFLAAFLLCQAVGRGLITVLRPKSLEWPSGLPRPPTPTHLLAYPSDRPDAFTFTLLVPVRGARARREDVILISDGLLADLSPVELEAVVAHELGHVRELDGRYLTFFRTFARMVRWDPLLALLAHVLTRREEFRADADAVEMTHRPRALARAIYKASRAPLSRPGPLAGLLGPGGTRGRRQATERIRRLIDLAESGRFPEEPGG
jgi:Zn-dependent protease with chaperone function